MSQDDGSTTAFLSDREIGYQVQAGQLITEFFDRNQLSGCSYDLRAGPTLSSRNRGRTFDISADEYVMEAGEVVTIQSLERIDLSARKYIGLLASNHTQVSIGLSHPFTVIDPGFKGPLAVTLVNQGNSSHRIKRGDRIAKLLFATVGPVDRAYGVDYRPRVVEGSIEHAHYVERERSRYDIPDLSDYLGGPLGDLADRVRRLEHDADLYRTQKALSRFRGARTWILVIVTAVASSVIAWALTQ